jgi:hypothetical protein
MSYCRFSSENFGCDVYVYESAEGFVTHVASNRHVGDTPVPETDGSIDRYSEQAAWLNKARQVRIGLPEDGKTHFDEYAGECADRLEALRNMGYHVPQYAIDALREEA